MRPDQTDVDNALSDWERIGQVLRGIGWALLTMVVLFASCAISILLVWELYKLARAL